MCREVSRDCVSWSALNWCLTKVNPLSFLQSWLIVFCSSFCRCSDISPIWQEGHFSSFSVELCTKARLVQVLGAGVGKAALEHTGSSRKITQMHEGDGLDIPTHLECLECTSLCEIYRFLSPVLFPSLLTSTSFNDVMFWWLRSNISVLTSPRHSMLLLWGCPTGERNHTSQLWCTQTSLYHSNQRQDVFMSPERALCCSSSDS